MGGLRVAFLIFIVASPIFFYGQNRPTILWRPDHRLLWSDFQGVPASGSRAAATTASGIAYRFSALERNGGMHVDCIVETFFYPESSWYRPNQANDVILSHEQLHFDISELFARRMRQRIAKYHFSSSVKREMKQIYEATVREMRKFQERYDLETDYSRDRAAQAEWNSRIASALRETIQ